MDPRLIKTEYTLNHSQWIVPNGSAQFPQNPPTLLPDVSQYTKERVQSPHIAQSVHSQYMGAANPQNVHPSALMVNEASTLTPNSNVSIPVGELGGNKQPRYTPLHIPTSNSSSEGELGRIVRPLSPTQQCRIQEKDMNHIGHILVETNASDTLESGTVCALSAKTLYFSNSGAVISTIDLPYYWCNFCTFKTEQKLVLLKHMMSHRFWCKWCRYQSYNRADVVRHCISTHPDQQQSVSDVKFCVLLPDYLLSRLDPEEKGDSSVKKVEPSLTKAHEEDDKMKESSPGTKPNAAADSATSEICKKKKGKGGRKRKINENNEAVDQRIKTDKDKATEKSEGNQTGGFSVCFECCTCHWRTLQKELIERHQQEADHFTTDKTTGKKTYVLKIITTVNKLQLQITDKQWLAEREGTSSRSRRRSKAETFNSFEKRKNDGDFSGANWDDDNAPDDDIDGELDDDDDDEDYVPNKSKKRSKNVWKRNSIRDGKLREKDDVSVSNVEIEIDTAGEPSSDTLVRSFSVASLNACNTVKVSPKKIVSRDIFDNRLTGELSISMPRAVKTEATQFIKSQFAEIKPVLLTPVASLSTPSSQVSISTLVPPLPIPVSTLIISSASSASVSTASTRSVPSHVMSTASITPIASTSTPPPAVHTSVAASTVTSNQPLASVSTSTIEILDQDDDDDDEETKMTVNKKGVYKCAHCRVVAERILQIRLHILDKHKENPLYCLDMEAADGVQPRYLLFCHFKDCKFFTKSRNKFLKHIETCSHNNRDNLSESQKKFHLVNEKFVQSTFPKLMKITKH